MDASEGPLDGVCVLDLAAERAGSVCAMLLAELGANVVRVESRDGSHARPDPTGDAGAVCWDHRKSRVVVDSLDPDLDGAMSRLVEDADVIVLDDTPSGLDTLGITTESLAARNPRAVVGWLPANGTIGPLAELPADPLVLSAISGFGQWQPSTTDEPVPPVVAFVPNVQGALGAAAIVAALIERRRSALGQVVSVSGLQAATLMLATVNCQSVDQPMAYSSNRDVRGAAAFRLYQCGDGEWFFLAALVPTIFLTALDAIDMLEVMVLPGIDGEFLNIFVGDNGVRVAERLEARFVEQPRQHWLDVFAAAGVPAAAVQTREQWLASDAFRAAAGVTERDHPTFGTIWVPSSPIRFSDLAGVRNDGEPAAAPDTGTGTGTGTDTVTDSVTVTDNGAPLAGLKVLDLCTFLAGPQGPTLLGQWGAEVIKVEPSNGDPYRIYNVAYTSANQGKRRVVLDLQKPDDMATLRRLATEADVIVDNFRPSLRTKLGMTTEALHAVNPRLVHTTLTAFGDHGPDAEKPGFDPVIQALSGLMDACGSTAPYYTSVPVHDVATGSLSALGTLAALYARMRHGHGQRVALSLAGSTLLVQAEELTDFAGRPPTARGAEGSLGFGPLRRYYRASDGWIVLSATSDQLSALMEWAGASGSGDTAGLAKAITGAVRQRSAHKAAEELRSRGVAAARVVERDDTATDPHLVAHDLLHVVTDPEIGGCRVVNHVAAWSRSTPVDTVHGPPIERDQPVWRTSSGAKT